MKLQNIRQTIFKLRLQNAIFIVIKGAGGVPWGQIMENEFEYLVDRGGHGGIYLWWSFS